MAVDLPSLLRALPDRYYAHRITAPQTVYLSVGSHKYTLRLTPDACEVLDGKPDTDADLVLKTTEALFDKMVVRGKLPGPIDVARGKVKTNDPLALKKLRDLFDFKGL